MERLELARLLSAQAPAGGRSVAGGAAPVVVDESDPVRFMRAFGAAAAGRAPVFLADPSWGAAERAALDSLLRLKPGATGERGWLMIPSGGTGGKLKFARHDQDTLLEAVMGFRSHFCADRINCIGVLPLHHVSGLMAWVRASLTGGTYQPWDWKLLEAGERPVLSPGGRWFLSLVPTQLQRLLASETATEWLMGFHAIMVGGGPVWPALAQAAACARLPLSPCYGMTETAAMVAALRPDEFLAGARGCGSALPHARISLSPEGVVRVSGASIFRGYYPEQDARMAGREFETGDLGAIDQCGHLRIFGRRDGIIITGGRKVDPAEVEASLWSTGEFSDVAVLGVPDAEWGEAVVAFYPSDQKEPDLLRVAEICRDLAGFKRPRRYQPVPKWPRNAQGKVNRTALLAAIRVD
jgi:o-succinylbenzoate---CoA ligase